MKKFYYIALSEGRTREGVVRAESIDSARHKLVGQGMQDINLAILRSDEIDFLDLDDQVEECANS